MNSQSNLIEELLERLPDIPRHVEIRGMLLGGAGELVGPVELDPLSCVILDGRDLVCAIGKPPVNAIREAAAGVQEVLAFDDNADHVASAIPEWNCEIATLHLLPEGKFSAKCSFDNVRMLAPGSVAGLSNLPGELAEELLDAEAFGAEIAAVFVDGSPVSFCYAGAVTETLWDVSIDTVEEHRRRGHAIKAASFMIEHWARSGKQPVWGAADSNPPSALLAAKLGFVPVDKLWLFTRPE